MTGCDKQFLHVTVIDSDPNKLIDRTICELKKIAFENDLRVNIHVEECD